MPSHISPSAIIKYSRKLYLLANSLLGNSLVGMSLAYPMGWVMCSLLMTVCYLRSPLCRRAKAPAEPAA